jgi:hypothetical protein
MIASALAVVAALLGIAAALLFAIRAREAERATAALDDRLASALREAERLRALSRVEASDRAAERDRLLCRAMAAEATAREWSDRASRAERELAEADRAIVQLSNECGVHRSAPRRNCDRPECWTAESAREEYWKYRDPLESEDKPFLTIDEWLLSGIDSAEVAS